MTSTTLSTRKKGNIFLFPFINFHLRSIFFNSAESIYRIYFRCVVFFLRGHLVMYSLMFKMQVCKRPPKSIPLLATILSIHFAPPPHPLKRRRVPYYAPGGYAYVTGWAVLWSSRPGIPPLWPVMAGFTSFMLRLWDFATQIRIKILSIYHACCRCYWQNTQVGQAIQQTNTEIIFKKNNLHGVH